MDVSYQVKHRLQAPILAGKCGISQWFPCGRVGRADGRTVPKFLRCKVLPMVLRSRVKLEARAINFSQGFMQKWIHWSTVSNWLHLQCSGKSLVHIFNIKNI